MARRRKPFSNEELVLKVEGPEPEWLDLYDDYLTQAADGRRYQVEAVRTVLTFLFGGSYASTCELAESTWEGNPTLKDRFTREEFVERVERYGLAGLLSCVTDHATGTGKSFVEEMVARVALNEGLVDRVLILTPSLTIEAGLKEKLVARLADTALNDLLPDRVGTKIPDVVDAGSTVRPGQICVENIHATYERTGSSIEDSFVGQGGRTLVISDEVHHLHLSEGNRWRAFLEDPRYGFHYHFGASGTCYVDNDYLGDVVHRYSIREATEDGWIKEAYYLDKDDSGSQDEIFQKLLTRHEKSRQTYGLKPLTICVTQRISGAEDLYRQMVDFLADHLPGGRPEAEEKVLVVTSDDKHADNLRRLATVDQPTDPTEWIISVSMLTEGWDVKNVFQIYPHEKRAFQSKLLISQVLGRGLRRPKTDRGGQQRVYVFNHPSWGPDVEGLVSEILDRDSEVFQRPVSRPGVAHFTLHNLEYDPVPVPTGIKATTVQSPIALEASSFHLLPQNDAAEETHYRSAVNADAIDVMLTNVYNRRIPLKDVVAEAHKRLRDGDRRPDPDGERTSYARIYSKAKLTALLVEALTHLGVGGLVDDLWLSQENQQRVFSTIGSLRKRKARPGAAFEDRPVGLTELSTAGMGAVRGQVAALAGSLTLFYDDLSLELSTSPDDKAGLGKAIEENEQRRINVEDRDSEFFRSPVNLVLVSHGPERRLVEQLTKSRHARQLSSWVKAPDQGFYAIEYSWRKPGKKTVSAYFNPDFFLLLADEDLVVVIEVKDDDDISPINVGKLKAARAHFELVNQYLEARGEARRYCFKFLSPVDYDRFLQAVSDGKITGFVSSIEGSLEAAGA